jgi:hypothetical protein
MGGRGWLRRREDTDEEEGTEEEMGVAVGRLRFAWRGVGPTLAYALILRSKRFRLKSLLDRNNPVLKPIIANNHLAYLDF